MLSNTATEKLVRVSKSCHVNDSTIATRQKNTCDQPGVEVGGAALVEEPVDAKLESGLGDPSATVQLSHTQSSHQPDLL
jgi:hypothetical protein